ncbi:MAG: BMP family ABC transporter substrate-binding protein [bacterium]|nr:BMP family ABC transporter substrate-binding protein [bacterium]
MRPWKILTTLVAAATLISVVAATPAGASHSANGTICIVNDIGGSESPFNEAAASGAHEAEAKLHVDVVIADAATEADIIANIDSFVTGGCDLIIGVAFIVGFQMEPFIAANPDQKFAVLDFSFGGIYDNVAEVNFDVNEGGFLAGYLAAGVSENGVVGVFGGLPIPPVTLFMDGYDLGVDWYNNVHGTSVEVLGWDADLQSGLFSFDFQNPALGQAITGDLFDAGADIVFPVAGVTGFGAVSEAADRKAAGDDVHVIGVDFDHSAEFGDPERVILTSVVKDLGVGVFNQIEALVDGTWTGGWFSEGLDGGAVDIAKFHKTTRDVPGFLKRDLKALRAGIIDGTIPTLP